MRPVERRELILRPTGAAGTSTPRRDISMSRQWVGSTALVLALLALAGCGSSSKTTSSSSTAPSSSAAATAVNPAIAASVPSKIKTKGTLNVASEAQYTPNELIAPAGKTVIGKD